jgi:hypothetical protein
MTLPEDKNYSICARCGFIGQGKRELRGSAWLEKFLWYVLLIPGPFYTFWRRYSASVTCPKCRSEDLFRMDSKMGQKIFERQMREFK